MLVLALCQFLDNSPNCYARQVYIGSFRNKLEREHKRWQLRKQFHKPTPHSNLYLLVVYNTTIDNDLKQAFCYQIDKLLGCLSTGLLDNELKETTVQSHKPIGKKRRKRTIFTSEQLKKLEDEFDKQQYLVGAERQQMAAALNLSETQVKIWFQNRRIKWRKENFHLYNEIQFAKFAF